ncbi:MAG TPA: hypothetical protein VGN65_01320 [Casimicrobiaceae bacterium]|jgi:hypothetical protein
MKERPILFSGEMVRVILDGRKTQTRRVVTPQPNAGDADASWPHDRSRLTFLDIIEKPEYYAACGWCRQGAPGDRLWVRETFFDYDAGEPAPRGATPLDHKVLIDERIEYRATPWYHEFADPEACGPWRPSIFMPRWASRITLEITAVRVERLQDINEADAIAEGCTGAHFENAAEDYAPTDEYRKLWDSLNAKRGYGWKVNPWVWVIQFSKLETLSAAA